MPVNTDEWPDWMHVWWVLTAIKRDQDARVTMRTAFNGASDRKHSTLWGHMNGARGELAVAMWLHVPWPARFHAYADMDIDPDVEVRHSINLGASLRLCDRDAPSTRAVLITGAGPQLYIQGWLHVRDGRAGEWWSPSARAWYVPQSELHGMNTWTR